MDGTFAPEIWLQLLINLSRYIDGRISLSGKHSAQVAEWSRATARRLGWEEGELRAIYLAALLHDIGKVGVPDEVLSKAGPLSEEEWLLMKLHPIVGANIIKSQKAIAHLAPVIYHHQEKYDGSGYPQGLRGEDIPGGARILAVVDAYDAMTDRRVYRIPLTHEEAVGELKRNGGTHFDPRVVSAFLEAAAPAPVYKGSGASPHLRIYHRF